MIYRDKRGTEILDGATVIYHGKEYVARDSRDGQKMYLQPTALTPDKGLPIPLENVSAKDLELMVPDESDFD